MSEKRQTAGKTADGTPTNAARNIENRARESGGLAKAVEAAMADGVTWDETNTEPAQKTFHVEIKFDLGDRLKLGMLAARCHETPERFLESQLRVRFDEMADKVFYGGGKKRTEADEAYSRSFEALYLATLESIVGKKEGRLAFRPAIMA